MKFLLRHLPWLEIALVYGLLFALQPRMAEPLLSVAFLAAGILFALFYHYLGIFAGCLFHTLALLRHHGWSVLPFGPADYLALVAALGAIYAVGQVRFTLQGTIQLLRRKDDLLEQRASNVLSELISFEVSHRVFLEDMYYRLDDPVYLYHELRRQSIACADETEFFAQVFKVLNRYLFVEKGIVYRLSGTRYDAVFRFGASELPEKIERAAQPAHFELIRDVRKVVFSRFPDRHGFLIAIPVFGTRSDEPGIVVVIERIRFIMLTARSAMSLKALSLLVQGIFERRFQREELQAMSATRGALVFDAPTTRRLLPKRIAFFEEAKIPYRALELTPASVADLEPAAAKMEQALRVLDEMYLCGGKLLAILLFTEHTAPVLARLRQAGVDPAIIEELSRAELQARMDRAS